jgi:hypothetical protein
MLATMRRSTKQGIGVGIAFGLFLGLAFGLSADPIDGAMGGLLGGALVALAVAWQQRRKEDLWARLREPYASEGLVHHGPAQCAIGPGYLMLTEKRVVWMPQVERHRDKKIILAREAITSVAPARGFGTNLRLEVYTGESVEFLVRARNTWLQHLRGTLRAPLPTARQLP